MISQFLRFRLHCVYLGLICDFLAYLVACCVILKLLSKYFMYLVDTCIFKWILHPKASVSHVLCLVSFIHVDWSQRGSNTCVCVCLFSPVRLIDWSCLVEIYSPAKGGILQCVHCRFGKVSKGNLLVFKMHWKDLSPLNGYCWNIELKIVYDIPDCKVNIFKYIG